MRKLLLSFVVVCGLTAPAGAVPIVYSGTLANGVPVTGVNNQTAANESNPVGAVYYSFFATAGSSVNIFGDRLSGHYDMSFWVFRGTYADTTDFGSSFPGAQGANFIAFGDDQDPPNIPGPFGDPNVTFTAPVTGFYTVAVTNFLSNAGPPNPFSLQANGVANAPEPATLTVFGVLAVGAFGVRRRLKASA